MRFSKEQLLKGVPPLILESEKLSETDKLVLGALVDYEQHSGAKDTGVIYISNSVLAGMIAKRKSDLYEAFRHLEDFQLIQREAGMSRKKGEKAEASRYVINYDRFGDELIEIPIWKRAMENAKKRQAPDTSETPLGTPYNKIKYNIIKYNKMEDNVIEEKKIEGNSITDNHLLQEDDSNNHLPTVTNEDNIIIEKINKTTSVEELLTVLREISIDVYDKNLELQLHEAIDNLSYLDEEDKQYAKELIHTKLTTQCPVVEASSWLDNLESILSD